MGPMGIPDIDSSLAQSSSNKDVADENSAYSHKSRRSHSVWGVVPIFEVFRLLLGNKGDSRPIFRSTLLYFRVVTPAKFYRNQPSRFPSRPRIEDKYTERDRDCSTRVL